MESFKVLSEEMRLKQFTRFSKAWLPTQLNYCVLFNQPQAPFIAPR